MDKYKIFKNGRVAEHPIQSETAVQNMADNDNLIRCLGCKTGYILPHKGRTELLYRVDYSKVDLQIEAVESNY